MKSSLLVEINKLFKKVKLECNQCFIFDFFQQSLQTNFSNFEGRAGYILTVPGMLLYERNYWSLQRVIYNLSGLNAAKNVLFSSFRRHGLYSSLFVSFWPTS